MGSARGGRGVVVLAFVAIALAIGSVGLLLAPVPRGTVDCGSALRIHPTISRPSVWDDILLAQNPAALRRACDDRARPRRLAAAATGLGALGALTGAIALTRRRPGGPPSLDVRAELGQA